MPCSVSFHKVVIRRIILAVVRDCCYGYGVERSTNVNHGRVSIASEFQ